MLELLVVIFWTAFVCAYLVWQQLTGDLVQDVAGHAPCGATVRLRFDAAERGDDEPAGHGGALTNGPLHRACRSRRLLRLR